LAGANGLTQLVRRSQRLGARRDNEPLSNADPQGRRVRRIEREVEVDVVDDGDQRLISPFDACRADAVTHRVIELGVEGGVGIEPGQGAGMRDVEVQPGERARWVCAADRTVVTDVCQPGSGLIGIDRTRVRVGAEDEAADEPGSVTAVGQGRRIQGEHFATA
jgi:hypothetical protein